ncbi:MarR family winged helix-turn-helix transcriptional regulator [Saccharothrix coeruleofusca]|uniref:MarR family transcriptional regulator n=1 Tax=Saccharothrix coeruleofusca TaxID=33919 RepID=A0A918APU8_9PSEU|nr:MarR family transcriptional regulator [Saccharothrix coeruleofusca]MBP2340775.1 DNA-binding MarR family transcriptional regulator [Saccharothrix coeruleofusca]GGP59724.1 MarR family transcriptional regulator [Saccharothrix coeruleofusca]
MEDATQRLGYRVKRAAAALRGALDRALREHDLTVPQYACLELLDQRPGLSNAELARGTFVTRQSMNTVLRGLQDSGLITRPAAADHGRALPAHLTEQGRRRLDAARSAVYAVDQRMTDAVPPERLADLLADLDRMAAAFER